MLPFGGGRSVALAVTGVLLLQLLSPANREVPGIVEVCTCFLHALHHGSFRSTSATPKIQRTRKGNLLNPLVLRVEHWGESGCIIQNGKEIIRKTSHEVLHMSQNMEKGPNGHTVIAVMAVSFEMRLLYTQTI